MVVPTLDKSIEFFESKRDEWLADGLEFKWFVVANGVLLGHYDEADAAYRHALEKASPGEFLVRQLAEVERPDSAPALQVGAIGGQ